MTPAREPGDEILAESAEDLYENAPCGYLSTAPDGTIVKVNRTFLEWTGFGREDLVGARRFHQLLTPGGQIYHETHYAPLLRMQGAVREIALEIVRADGSGLPVLVNAVLRRDGSGQPAVIRTTVFNATDRQRYERELVAARERERDARKRAERLEEFAAELAAALTPEDVARALGDAVAAQTGAAGAVFGAVERPASFHTLARWGAAPPQPPRRGAIPTEEPGSTVIPLSSPAGPNVVLCVRRPSAGFSAADRRFVEACAAHSAQALERARLHEQTRSVALTLQRSLLEGEPPDDPRFEVAARYLPGVESLEVGGDWYDVFAVGPERVGLVVGDVVGRGLRAATAMGQLRSAARAIALAGGPPGEVLAGLHRFAVSVAAAQMATTAYCEVDVESRRVRYACAGHPPPALMPPDGPPAFLWDARSAPLGVGGARGEAEVQIEPGSRLLLYTDGLVERRGRLIDEGLERLAGELARARHASPAEVVSRLTDALLADVAHADDACALCLLFRG